MKNKGFALIDFIVIVAIIGIIGAVVLFSIKRVEERKKEEEKKVNSTQVEKIERFNRIASFAKEMGEPVLSAVEKPYSELTMKEACGNIPNQDSKKECEESFNQTKNIQNCIERYTK